MNITRKWMTNAGLILLSGLLTLILVEILLAFFSPTPYSEELEFLPDGFVRFRPAPNRTYKLKSGGRCSVNNLGFRRDGDIEYLKPPDTFRIVILGGSVVFSYDSDDAKTCASRLESKLRDTYKDRKIEVINAGVPGYSVFESKLNYLYKIRRMSPDVVLVYHTWNDMKYFKALEAGEVIQKGPYYRSSYTSLKGFLRPFNFYQRIRVFYHKVYLPVQRENVYATSADIKSISQGGPAHQWERRNFNDLALILKADGVLSVMLTQASLLSEENLDDPEVRANVYSEYQGLSYRQILEQWQIVSKIIREVARKNNAVFIDAYSQLSHDLNHFLDHVHLTEQGDEKLAEIIFEVLKENVRFNNLIIEK